MDNQNINAMDNSQQKCSSCGTVLQDGQVFCPTCGHRAGIETAQINSTTSTAINQYNSKAKKKKALVPIIIGIIAVIVGVVLFLLLKGPSVEAIELSETTLDIRLGASETITYTITPTEASDVEVDWKTSDESIATVNSNGKIVGKAEGTCTVTVTAGKKTDSVTVNVVLTPAMLMEEGKYEEAYLKANGSEKEAIADANLVAYISNMCVNSLKDSKSFELRDAWVNHGDDNTHQIVLKVAANNSYGNTVINYWFYSYDKDTKEYELWDAYSDLDEEDYYSWQDYDEKVEILLNNAIKERIKEIMSASNLRLESDNVDIINTLFENGLLNKVKLLDCNKK